ncbi:MAG: MFS transporter [Hyphomonadaceae bacterium]|nr:MFS transporter [Hyphomonadaceae bacterium]
MADAPAPDLSDEDRRKRFYLLYGALFVVGFGNSMLFPLLPPLVRELGLPDSSIGWIFSLSALIWVFSSPVWGRVSDRVGRKPIVALGLFAYCLSMGAFALVAALGVWGMLHGVWIFVGLILTRAIFGLAGSASSPAAQAYVADRTAQGERTKELALLGSAFAIGGAIGPAACAMLAAELGLIFPIGLTSALAFIAGVVLVRFLPERRAPARKAEDKTTMMDSWSLARDPRVAAYLGFGVALSVVTGTLSQIYSLYVMDRLGASGELGAELAAGGFAVGALAMLTTQMAILPMLKLGSRTLMMVGCTILCFSVLVQIWAPNYSALLFSQILAGLGFGLARPGFTGGSSMAVRPDEQGAVAGLVVASNGAGFVISPLTGGLAYQYLGPTAPLWASLVLLFAMTIFVWRSRRLRNLEAADAAGLDSPH